MRDLGEIRRSPEETGSPRCARIQDDTIGGSLESRSACHAEGSRYLKDLFNRGMSWTGKVQNRDPSLDAQDDRRRSVTSLGSAPRCAHARDDGSLGCSDLAAGRGQPDALDKLQCGPYCISELVQQETDRQAPMPPPSSSSTPPAASPFTARSSTRSCWRSGMEGSSPARNFQPSGNWPSTFPSTSTRWLAPIGKWKSEVWWKRSRGPGHLSLPVRS